MPSLEDFIQTVNAINGDLHPLYENVDPTADYRIPSGIFLLDFALAGGIPLRHSSLIYGPDGGGKTTTAISLMSSVSRTCFRCFNPLLLCNCEEGPYKVKSFWADVEGTLDVRWCERLGAVKGLDFIYKRGGYAEQVFEWAQQAARTDEIGLIVIDSIAAMSSRTQMESSTEKKFYAELPRVLGDCVKRLKTVILEESERGHQVAVLYLNQVRESIGQMFGDPEYFPGGNAVKHDVSLIVRVGKKSLKSQPKYFNDENQKWMATLHHFSVRKTKVATLMGEGEFIRANQSIPALDLTKGHVDDMAMVEKLARRYGILSNENGWSFDGQPFNTLKAIKTHWRDHPEVVSKLRSDLISAAINEVTNDGNTETNRETAAESTSVEPELLGDSGGVSTSIQGTGKEDSE